MQIYNENRSKYFYKTGKSGYIKPVDKGLNDALSAFHVQFKRLPIYSCFKFFIAKYDIDANYVQSCAFIKICVNVN